MIRVDISPPFLLLRGGQRDRYWSGEVGEVCAAEATSAFGGGGDDVMLEVVIWVVVLLISKSIRFRSAQMTWLLTL